MRAMDWSPLGLSLWVATVSTIVALLVGVPCAFVLARKRVWGHRFLEALVMLPLVLPPTVLGYYLLAALGRGTILGRAYERATGSPLTFTVEAAVLAGVVHALPLTVRTVRAALDAVDPTLEFAARALGATEWRVATTITLPLARRGVAAAAALSFARALGEFGVTLVIAGNIPGVTRTASIAVYEAMQAGRDAEAQALVAVLAAIAIATVVLVGRLGEPRTVRHEW
ncbi:MAG: molybdate ABC transporter permease subunit [Myxococcales bacterium]|nr:molybdate ABC transporter permease subunit [Myxococcales bacterium]